MKVFSKEKYLAQPSLEYLKEASLRSGWVDECDGKHGFWLYAGHDTFSHYRRCSACKKLLADSPAYTYCPNCGAKMDLEVDNAP